MIKITSVRLTIIKAAINFFSSRPALFTTLIPICCASPVWNIAAPITNIPANKTTVELDKPKNTWDGVSTPKSPKAIEAPIAVTANGIISVAKQKAATARTHKVITAGSTGSPPLLNYILSRSCFKVFSNLFSNFIFKSFNSDESYSYVISGIRCILASPKNSSRKTL